MTLWTDLLALGAYAAATLLYPQRMASETGQRQLLILAAAAIALHAPGLAPLGGTDAINLGFGSALSLFLWQCAAVHALALVRFPLWHLAPTIWPMAALGIALAWWLPQGTPARVELGPALRVHIALSLLAWAVLTLAALQTISYAIRERRLHRHRPDEAGTVVPLQTMESLVFGLMGVGFVLLCLSVASGFLFVENFTAQHLVHKSVLSLVACAVFGALLTGRLVRGWRGRAAIRWTLGGYGVLLLAYFGSKFVLEQVLGRTWG